MTADVIYLPSATDTAASPNAAARAELLKAALLGHITPDQFAEQARHLEQDTP